MRNSQQSWAFLFTRESQSQITCLVMIKFLLLTCRSSPYLWYFHNTSISLLFSNNFTPLLSFKSISIELPVLFCSISNFTSNFLSHLSITQMKFLLNAQLSQVVYFLLKSILLSFYFSWWYHHHPSYVDSKTVSSFSSLVLLQCKQLTLPWAPYTNPCIPIINCGTTIQVLMVSCSDICNVLSHFHLHSTYLTWTNKLPNYTPHLYQLSHLV